MNSSDESRYGTKILVFLVVAFGLTPAMCVLGSRWYGETGEITDNVSVSIFLTAPIHACLIFIPKTTTGQTVSICLEIVLLGLVFGFWFLLAAAIASV